MSQSSQLWPRARELEELQARFPGWEITKDRRVRPVRWHAVARSLGTKPYTVITSDVAELIALLSGGGGA